MPQPAAKSLAVPSGITLKTGRAAADDEAATSCSVPSPPAATIVSLSSLPGCHRRASLSHVTRTSMRCPAAQVSTASATRRVGRLAVEDQTNLRGFMSRMIRGSVRQRLPLDRRQWICHDGEVPGRFIPGGENRRCDCSPPHPHAQKATRNTHRWKLDRAIEPVAVFGAVAAFGIISSNARWSIIVRSRFSTRDAASLVPPTPGRSSAAGGQCGATATMATRFSGWRRFAPRRVSPSRRFSSTRCRRAQFRNA